MGTKLYFHSGFCFAVSSEVLPALTLTHLVGKDLRKAEGLLDRFFIDMLMKAQERFGSRLHQELGPLMFEVGVDARLFTRLLLARDEVHCSTHLVSRNPRVEALVRRLLPAAAKELRVVDSVQDLQRLPPGDLVLLDALGTGNGALSHPVGLDHLVLRQLVDARTVEATEPSLREWILPIQVNSRKGILNSQERAGDLLAEALDLAKFSRFFERCRLAHLRWRTHLELNYLPESQCVQGTLFFDGEDRVLHAQDLKRDIPWAEIPSLRFSDVLGLQSTKTKLQDYLDWLKDPCGEPGIRACVVDGPPGTGKTLVCTATAGEAHAPCIVMGGSEFLNKWYGETERIIRETFASLQHYDAAVLVIDEFDAVAWRRDQSNDWQAETQSSVVGEMLRSIDRLRKGPGRILLLATTNQYNRIDPALVRSMRMGDRIHLGLPDAEDRRAMLQGLLKSALGEADLAEVVGMTTGLSPADLTQLVDKARKQAARTSEFFSIAHLRASVFELRRGEADGSRHLDQATKHRVAFHEAGHALVAFHLLGPDTIEHLSVIPAASGSLGAAYRRRSESMDLLNRGTIERQLAVLMAGRVAEALSHPEAGPSCGAEADLQEATRLAQHAVSTWGLDSKFPLLSLEALPSSIQQSLAPRLVERIEEWIQTAEAFARTELVCHREQLELLALRLAEAETLHHPDLMAILGVSKEPIGEANS